MEEFVAELLSFPGRHDDQVDALTQGLAWGRQQWSRKVVEVEPFIAYYIDSPVSKTCAATKYRRADQRFQVDPASL
jgi:hypothetical protein